MSKCPDCRVEVIWLVMEGSGKKLSVNVRPSVRGTIAIVAGNRALFVPFHKRARALAGGRKLYEPHLATCLKKPRTRERNPAARAHLLRVMASLGTGSSSPAPKSGDAPQARPAPREPIQRDLFGRRS